MTDPEARRMPGAALEGVRVYDEVLRFFRENGAVNLYVNFWICKHSEQELDL